jgi:hypothetical protein
VESESPRDARALDQHPQDVILADSAAALALLAVVRANAEERGAVPASSGQGIGGANAVSLQGIHDLGCGSLELGEQIVCSVPGHRKIRG